MTPQELTTLVDFNYWARDRVLDAVEPLSAEQRAYEERVRYLFRTLGWAA